MNPIDQAIRAVIALQEELKARFGEKSVPYIEATEALASLHNVSARLTLTALPARPTHPSNP